MKYLRSNGRVLEVREYTPIIYRVKAIGKVPIPLLSGKYSNQAAKEMVEKLIASPEYKGEAID